MDGGRFIGKIWYDKAMEELRLDLIRYSEIFKKGGDTQMADPKLDYKSVREEAEAEVKSELADKAKREYKVKLKELAGAETVVTNIKRELEDLDDKYSQK